MNKQAQAVLNALKNQALLKYLTPIAEQPFIFSSPQPQPQHYQPFQLYQYQQPKQSIQTSYNALQNKMRSQILYRFNQYLFDNEEAQLQMQLFCLKQAIQMRENQIQFMKVEIENERINSNMRFSHLSLKLKREQNQKLIVRDGQDEIMKMLHTMKEDKQDINNNESAAASRFKIYSSLNCEIQPDENVIKDIRMSTSRNKTQNNPLKLNFNELKKSHRQSHAIYSRRSQAYSSDNQDKFKNKNNKKVEADKQDTVLHNKKTQRQIDLKTIQNQISFYQRAWKDAKKSNQKQKARQLKKKIFEKLQQFWGLKKQ